MFAARLPGAGLEQFETEQTTPHTCEYSNPKLKINTVGGYVYFAIRMTRLL